MPQPCRFLLAQIGDRSRLMHHFPDKFEGISLIAAFERLFKLSGMIKMIFDG